MCTNRAGEVIGYKLWSGTGVLLSHFQMDFTFGAGAVCVGGAHVMSGVVFACLAQHAMYMSNFVDYWSSGLHKHVVVTRAFQCGKHKRHALKRAPPRVRGLGYLPTWLGCHP